MEENRFKKLRMELNPNDMEEYKAKDLSKELGIAAPKISELEHGRAASLSELQAYHKYFNVPYEYLLGENDSRYYEHMTQSDELGLSGQSLEILKRAYKRFKRIEGKTLSVQPQDREPDGILLRTLNYMIEDKQLLYDIGNYLESAQRVMHDVQVQYIGINIPDTSSDQQRIELIKRGKCELFHESYEEFCDMYLNGIIKKLRRYWKQIHESYEKENIHYE